MTQASSWSNGPPLQRPRSHDLSEHRPRTFPPHPICPRCDVPMWLSKVRTEPKKIEYFYECRACEDKRSILVAA
jgi:hypothetical protein